MDVLILSQKLENRSEESDDSDIEELEESDWTSDLESLNDSVEDKGFFDDCIDPQDCDNVTGEEIRTFQPIATPPIATPSIATPLIATPLLSHIRLPQVTPLFQNLQPTSSLKLPKLSRRLSSPQSLESDTDSLSSFTDISLSPEFLSYTQPLLHLTGRFLDTDSSFDRSDDFSLRKRSALNSHIMPTINKAGLPLQNPSSVFRIYSRPSADLSSCYSSLSALRVQMRPEPELSVMNLGDDPEASLDSTGSCPGGLSDDEVCEVFSDEGLQTFTATPPLCFRPISRAAGIWSGLDDDDYDERSWTMTQRFSGLAMRYSRSARNHFERSSGVRRWVRSQQGRFSFSSETSRSTVMQRPSLDFDKMQKFTFGRKYIQNGVNKPRVVKVKNLGSSSSYKSASQLFDPAVFCFRSLSLRPEHYAPTPSPSRRVVYSAPPGTMGGESPAATPDGAGFETSTADFQNTFDIFGASDILKSSRSLMDLQLGEESGGGGQNAPLGGQSRTSYSPEEVNGVETMTNISDNCDFNQKTEAVHYISGSEINAAKTFNSLERRS